MTDPTYSGGPNIAMKVPPAQWDATVAFYRDTLHLEEIDNPYGGLESIGFVFGANRLWIDKVPTMSQAEVWLQIVTPDAGDAAIHLQQHGVTRCDEIEDLGQTTSFWISSPASVVHLVADGPN